MLNDTHKEAIRALYQTVSESIPGFRKRYGQREMVAHISRALAGAGQSDGANIAVVEGRTGVGKTVGYLVPALVMARELKKKLILSTGTVALQEQLFSRDLPAVLSCMDPQPTFALLKGRGRFVCPTRLGQLGGNAGQETLFEDATWDRRPEEVEIRWLRKVAQEFDEEKWNGDADTLTTPPPTDLWKRVANNRHSCVGKKCDRYAACPYFKSLEFVRTADIVVANHDLVLSCISAGSKLLPEPADSFYVFDEAHHLPAVALNRFAEELSTGARHWISRLPSIYTSLFAALPGLAGDAEIARVSKSIAEALAELEVALRHNPTLKDKNSFRFPQGQLDAQFAGAAKGISNQATELLDNLTRVQDGLAAALKIDPALFVSLQAAINDAGFAFARLENFARAAELFAADVKDGSPLAKWVAAEGGRAGGYCLHTSPILAGPILRELVWSRVSAAVLTSATLTSLGDFGFFLRNVGLNGLAGLTAAAVASPFDYAAQGEIVIPRMRTDPGKPEEHTLEINQLLPAHLDAINAGALVLFASKKQMQAVHAALPAALRDDVLMQGERSRADLISTHIERVRAGRRSILFGLSSFGEGLDLPGSLCEGVFIAKLPFSPPDSPIEEAQAEWVEGRGGNPFMEITLPKAGLTLIQWAGRLIRSETDRGRVVLFDSRVNTKRYGSQLLSGLPPFRRVAA